eukprot:jgi/Tetstr1/440675/TSEL_028984.t1
MLETINRLRAAGVEVASLIHDGALIKASDEHLVDMEKLGSHVRNATGLVCSFAVKSLDLNEDDKAWAHQVEEGIAGHANELKEIADARDDNTKLIVEAGLEKGHRLLAMVLHEMFPDKLAYLGKTEGWYIFKEPRWQSISHDTQCIMTLMDDDLHESVSKALENLVKEDIPSEDAVKGVEGLLKNIAKIPFKKNLVEQLSLCYQVADPKMWLNQLDGNDLLLGLEDCVYDFHDRCFRDGLPEDMVSMSTGHSRSDIENT